MNMPASPDRAKVALIAGPTASGKSALALALAERTGGVIINADASQVYRDLRILTARPTPTDEARVPHRLYGYRDAAEACSAAAWAADARRAIAEVVHSKRLPILVGGTGLYFTTLIRGIAPVPPIDPAIRAAIRALTANEAHAALQREDPPAAARLHPNDTTRTQRALETIRSTGRSIGDWRARRVGGIADLYRFELTHVDPAPDALCARCDARAEAMLTDGAIEEVRALAARGLDPALPAMRAIGVAPLVALLAGAIDAAQALAAVQQATRAYAKRQRTWFRNQPILMTPDHSDRGNES